MQITPFFDYGFGLGIDPFNYRCCGTPSQVQPGAPQFYKGTPYYKQIIAMTGGNPATNLDELLTKGFFTDGDVITARVGTYFTNDWMLLAGPAVDLAFEVSPQDYSLSANNVHWRLVAGNIS